tara:strand:- start:3723 stop:4412 length:690 start_codon:yes stop_codon:yes gene_type:complete
MYSNPCFKYAMEKQPPGILSNRATACALSEYESLPYTTQGPLGAVAGFRAVRTAVSATDRMSHDGSSLTFKNTMSDVGRQSNTFSTSVIYFIVPYTKKNTHTTHTYTMATIKIVGEDWCPFTKGTATEKGAWLAAADLSGWNAATGMTGAQGASGTTQITYVKLDCKATGLSADDQKLCDAAQGFPSFMDSAGNTCTRGFDRAVGFGDGTTAGITKTIQDALNSENKCE